MKLDLKKKIIISLLSFGILFSIFFIFLMYDNFKQKSFTLNQITIIFDIIIYFIFILFFYLRIQNNQLKIFNERIKKIFRKDYLNFFISVFVIILGIVYFNLSSVSYNNEFFYPRTIYGFIKYISYIIVEIPVTYGIFLVVTYLLSYRILRFSLNRYFSIFGSLIFVTSEIHLYNLIPSVERDYFKVILLLSITLTLIFIFRSKNFKEKKYLYFFLAFLVGFGLTIRNDILIYLIPILASIFYHIKKPVIFSLKFLFIVFIIFLMIPARGTLVSSMPIVLITGLMKNFDILLGHENYYYYLSRISEQPFVEYYLSKLNQNYIITYTQYFIFFCFDFLQKSIFSINHVLNLFYIYSDVPLMFENKLFGIYKLKKLLLSLFIGYGSLIFVLSIFILKNKIKSNKDYYFLIFYLLYLLSTPLMYFYTRHYFHLEILSIWSFFYLIQNLKYYLLHEKKN